VPITGLRPSRAAFRAVEMPLTATSADVKIGSAECGSRRGAGVIQEGSALRTFGFGWSRQWHVHRLRKNITWVDGCSRVFLGARRMDVSIIDELKANLSALDDAPAGEVPVSEVPLESVPVDPGPVQEQSPRLPNARKTEVSIIDGSGQFESRGTPAFPRLQS
jgi:hypothetical protein